MNRYLLDTHALIWFLEGNEILPSRVRSIIMDTEVNVFISIVTLWEIAIKISIGKLQLTKTLSDIIDQLAEDKIIILPVETPALLHLLTMPFHHKDPFDRIIIAQAFTENVILLSNENIFDVYKARRIWEG